MNNLHANWQLNPALQLGLQYGVRYVSSTFEGEKYAGISDIVGLRPAPPAHAPLRPRACTPRCCIPGNRTSSTTPTGFDVGTTFAKNVWISVGYNFAGFRDDDFSASRHTAQGPYLKIRIKADQDTFKDLNLDSLRPSR